MKLTHLEVARIAKLAKLELSSAHAEQTLGELNSVFDIFERLQAVNTDGVLPLTHPTSVSLRLREDQVTEPNRREAYQSVAPETEAGLYLVPKVIE